MVTNYPVNSRVRAYGKARIDIAQRAKTSEEWGKLWVRPSHSFPFEWGKSWKQCIEYKVDDFAAEVGFFIDVLGFPVNALDPGYAMFTSPQGDFFFSVVPTPPDGTSTPQDAIRLQFMVSDIFATTRELEKREIAFEQPPQPLQPDSSLQIAYFRTPHGISVDLWGVVKPDPSTDSALKLVDQGKDEDESDDEEDDLETEELAEEDEDEDDFSVGFTEGENDDEFDEDSDDDELIDDEDEDVEEEDDDFEDDEDKFDSAQVARTLNSIFLKANPLASLMHPENAGLKPKVSQGDEQKTRRPEYIDLDTT